MRNPNPLGAALALLLGTGAATLTAWQQAVVAAVFELSLVGVLVIYELLGHVKLPSALGGISARKGPNAPDDGPEMVLTVPFVPSQPRKTVAISPKAKVGSTKTYVRDRVFPADGDRTEFKALIQDYRAWCAQRGLMPLELNPFLDEIEKLLRTLGIEMEVGGDQRVYCLGIRLTADGSAATRTRSYLELRNH